MPGRSSRVLPLSLLLLPIILLIVPWPGFFSLFRVTHEQTGRELFALPFIHTHSFDLSFINSIYLAPTVEKFETSRSAISLREIQTTSWGVVEYYSIKGNIREEKGTIRIQDIHFHTPRLKIMIGYIGKQKLIWEGRTYDLYALTEPGAVLIFEPVRLSPAEYLREKLGKWFKER
jgi:hypothetical protein